MTPHMNRLRLHSPSKTGVTALMVAPYVFLALAMALGAGAAVANDDASRWDGDARSAARLIAGGRGADALLRAGIEIKLKPGWHTYWRYPGDAGVPPQFDFAGSQNLKTVEVRWAVPQRIEEAGLITIGYDRDLTLPLRVTAQDAAKPVTLRLKLNYAICEKLCVPAEAKLELPLVGGASAQEAALAAAEARVPKKRALGEGAGLAVRSVRRDAGASTPRLLIDVAAPGSGPVDLFAEGPTDQWAPPLPVAVPGASPPVQRFMLDLDGAPPGEKYEGALMTFTAVQDGEAIEVQARAN